MAEVFNIQLETDLSEFDSTVTDSGDLSQSGAAALAGTSGGLSCLLDDTVKIYGQKNFTLTTDDLRVRFYVDPNALTMADGDKFIVVVLENSVSPDVTLLVFEMRYYTATGYRISVAAQDDGGGWHTDSHHYLITDAEHYVEAHLERASSNVAGDGQYRLYIDGVLQETVSSIDNWDMFQVASYLRAGAEGGIDAGTSGTFYLDEIVLRDDATVIGPVAGGPLPMAMNEYHRRRV